MRERGSIRFKPSFYLGVFPLYISQGGRIHAEGGGLSGQKKQELAFGPVKVVGICEPVAREMGAMERKPQKVPCCHNNS